MLFQVRIAPFPDCSKTYPVLDSPVLFPVMNSFSRIRVLQWLSSWRMRWCSCSRSRSSYLVRIGLSVLCRDRSLIAPRSHLSASLTNYTLNVKIFRAGRRRAPSCGGGRLSSLQAVLRCPVAKQGKPGVSVKIPGAGFYVFGYDFSVFGKISLLRICFREIYSE